MMYVMWKCYISVSKLMYILADFSLFFKKFPFKKNGVCFVQINSVCSMKQGSGEPVQKIVGKGTSNGTNT